MKQTMALLLIFCLCTGVALAKGGGGGHGGGGHSSGGRGISSSKGSFSGSRSGGSVSKPSVSTRPSSATVKTTTNVAKTSSTGKTMSKEGSVVDSNYQPKFRGGYVPPAGSTVYYSSTPDYSWLPFYMMMSSHSEEYKHQEAVVVTPDGKEQTVVDDEVSDAYVMNWFITIIFIVGVLGFIGWLIIKE